MFSVIWNFCLVTILMVVNKATLQHWKRPPSFAGIKSMKSNIVGIFGLIPGLWTTIVPLDSRDSSGISSKNLRNPGHRWCIPSGSLRCSRELGWCSNCHHSTRVVESIAMARDEDNFNDIKGVGSWWKQSSVCVCVFLGGGFKYFLFSPLFGEDSHFD